MSIIKRAPHDAGDPLELQRLRAHQKTSVMSEPVGWGIWDLNQYDGAAYGLQYVRIKVVRMATSTSWQGPRQANRRRYQHPRQRHRSDGWPSRFGKVVGYDSRRYRRNGWWYADEVNTRSTLTGRWAVIVGDNAFWGCTSLDTSTAT